MDETAEREFTAFVVERGHRLLRVAYALTGNQQAAEDLLQTALAKTALHWSRVEHGAEMYVRKILYHDHVSRWRKLRRLREVPVDALPDHGAGGDLSRQVADRLAVHSALLRLPPRQRAVLVLRYLEDLSEKQVAQVLGCSPGTVASQASRALARLRELVNSQGLLASDADLEVMK
ncbi:RNA polymerase sigma-70 factor, sigma-E family [Asanoa hainanensis]|uniref:RNA polymerase sigma-70 factor, sigma-E family n=1 Tax=Asanoa hainanensis TaxID=560556 RepID=A0A239M5R8_9ACTN|nr:SigE family RNA polymerase sigma factor [Asanoa hainanensis]SNT37189.1 RNA polymerase sigma-70 factor, sigma-E family [Asanoa hainanensis]